MKTKKLFIVLTFLICSNITFSQIENEKAFIDIAENLSKLDLLNDYKERFSLSADYKNKLIISDIKEKSILKNMLETENLIIASFDVIKKAQPKFYVVFTKTLFTSDSSYVEFNIVNDYKLKISGKFTLIPDNSKLTADKIKYKTRADIVSFKE